MMTIKEQLYEDMKGFMRRKDKKSLTTIRMIIDRIQKKEKETQADLAQEETIQILQTFKKQINEEIDGFQKVGNNKQVEKLLEDLGIIENYLPKQMSKEEVKLSVESILDTMGSGTYDKGSIMKAVMGQLKGKADNKTISEIVTEIFNQNK